MRVVTVVIGTAIAIAAVPFADANASETDVVCESDASGFAVRCRERWQGEDAAPFRRVAPLDDIPTGMAGKPAQPLLSRPSTRTPVAQEAPAYLRQAEAGKTAPIAAPGTPETPATVGNATRAEASTVASRTTAPPVSELRATPISDPAAAAAASVGNAAIVAARPAPVAPEREADRAPRQQERIAPAVAQPIDPATLPTGAASGRSAVTVVETGSQATAMAATASPVENDLPSTPVRLLDGSAFSRLPGSRYTLEIANADTPQPLRELANRLQLAGDVYLIHLRNPAVDRWLLAWSDYGQQGEARAALALVASDPAINAGWARRIAPLQSELALP